MEERLLTEDEIYAQIKERIKGEFVPLFTKKGKPVDVGYNKTTRLVYKNVDEMVSIASHHTEEESKAIRDARRRQFEKDADQIELKRFEKAKKIKLSEYTGEQFFFNEGFDVDIETILDDFFNIYGADYSKYPRYVWATKPEPYIVSRDAFDVYENDLGDLSDECDWPVEGVKDLQKALDEFAECNEHNKAYWADYDLALLIDDEIEEYRKRYEDED